MWPLCMYTISRCFTFFQKLQHVVQAHILEGKKGKKTSKLRDALENGLVILEFQKHVEDTGGQSMQHWHDDLGDDWTDILANTSDLCIEERVSSGPSRIFVHIGRINFKTWHFGAFQLEECISRPSILPEGVLILQPRFVQETEQQKCVFSDYELFAHVLDTKAKWKLRFYTISLDPSHWVCSDIETIVACPTDEEEFIIWQGSLEEAERRRSIKKKQGQNKRKQKGNTDICPRKRARTKSLKKNEDRMDSDRFFEPLQEGFEPEIDIEDIFDDGNLDVPVDVADMYGDGDDDADIDKELPEDENDLHVDDRTSDEVKPAPFDSDLANPTDNIDINDEKFLQEEMFNLDFDFDLDQHQQEVEQIDPVESDRPPLPPPDVPPEEGEKKTVDRPLGISRSNANRAVYVLPDDGGEIHYYYTTGTMVAFCKHRNGLHSSGCRKSATTEPKQRGSGRPLGLLTAWLRCSDDYDSKTSHVHSCLPSLQERQSAGAFFNSLDGSQSISRFEAKKKNEADPDEPVKP